jgi:cytochrome c
MLSKFRAVAVVIGLACFMTTSSAAERGTPKEAEAMVRKGIAYMQASGLARLLQEVGQPGGSLIDRDLYLAVLDGDGKLLAHGANARMVGKDLTSIKDMNGKEIFKETIALVRAKGKGWVDYTWPNPVTAQLEHKTTYVEKFQGVIFICGAYK